MLLREVVTVTVSYIAMACFADRYRSSLYIPRCYRSSLPSITTPLSVPCFSIGPGARQPWNRGRVGLQTLAYMCQVWSHETTSVNSFKSFGVSLPALTEQAHLVSTPSWNDPIIICPGLNSALSRDVTSLPPSPNARYYC